MKIIYGIRKQRRTLEESLKTKKIISYKEFKKILKDYKYYGYDKRCNQQLYININLQYTWLYMEFVNE